MIICKSLLLHSSIIPIRSKHGAVLFAFPEIVAVFAELFPYDAAITTYWRIRLAFLSFFRFGIFFINFHFEVKIRRCINILWQEFFRVLNLIWQIFINNIIKAPFCKCLLFCPNFHLVHLIKGFLPFFVVDNKWVIL